VNTCVFVSGVCIFVTAERVWVDIAEAAKSHQDEAWVNRLFLDYHQKDSVPGVPCKIQLTQHIPHINTNWQGRRG